MNVFTTLLPGADCGREMPAFIKIYKIDLQRVSFGDFVCSTQFSPLSGFVPGFYNVNANFLLP
jgi:hypothetical protein